MVGTACGNSSLVTKEADGGKNSGLIKVVISVVETHVESVLIGQKRSAKYSILIKTSTVPHDLARANAGGSQGCVVIRDAVDGNPMTSTSWYATLAQRSLQCNLDSKAGTV